MFGDVLKKRLYELQKSSLKKSDYNAFWRVLRNIAVEDILKIAPLKVDSDIAIAIYYDILSKNEGILPATLRMKLNSNNQERFRVVNRNLWSSNAFHPEGIANQPGIKTLVKMNENRKGKKIIFWGEKNK